MCSFFPWECLGLCFCFHIKKAAHEPELNLVLEFRNYETYYKDYGVVLSNTYSIHRMYFSYSGFLAGGFPSLLS